MIVAVADTHCVIWYMSGDTNLSLTAQQFMNEAAH